MIRVAEDTEVHTYASNPTAAYLDAKERAEMAFNKHKDFFESDEHLDRLEAVIEILKKFFNQLPSYITPRGLGSQRPFEAVKMQDVGYILRRKSADVKWNELYKPLLDVDKVKVDPKNGHLIVRIYKK